MYNREVGVDTQPLTDFAIWVYEITTSLQTCSALLSSEANLLVCHEIGSLSLHDNAFEDYKTRRPASTGLFFARIQIF